MNCDEAFDCLTDPRRRHDAALARHLEGCPRCRRMQETLEPALDLFYELAEEPDLSGLPPLAGTASSETVRVAEQTAARLQSHAAPRRRLGFAALRYAAMALMGAGVMAALGYLEQKSPPEQPASGCLWRAADALPVTPGSGTTVTLRCMGCHVTYDRSGADEAATGEPAADAQRAALALGPAASEFPFALEL